MSGPAPSKIPVVAFYGFRGGDGGISHVMLNLMNATVDLGATVHLLLNATNIPELTRVDPRIKIFRLGEGGSFKRLKALADYLRVEGPDALLCLDYLPVSLVYPAYAGAGFALIAVAGNMLFNENLGLNQWSGVALIFAGIVVASR